MRLLRNANISKKLFFLIFTFILFLVSVGFTGYYYMQSINHSADSMYEDYLLPVMWNNDNRANLRAQKAYLLEHILSPSMKEQKELETKINERKEKIASNLKLYAEVNLQPYEKEHLTSIQKSISSYYSLMDQVLTLSLEEKNDEALKVFREELSPLLEKITLEATKLAEFNADYAKEMNVQNNKEASFATTIMISLSVSAVLLSVLLGVLITNMIARPLAEIKDLMGKAQAGDLTVHGTYQSKDEVGQMTDSFNRMTDNLRHVIERVITSSNSLASASEEISASTNELALGSSQQAESATLATEMVQDMAEAVQAVARNAELASASSEQAVQLAAEGEKVINGTLQKMGEINLRTQELASKSTQIGDIIEVIDDIAEQTNLLALNAAIEAARAGEAGKGFAVVADEVRKLAERSGIATKQISDLIKGIQLNTLDSVKAVEAGNEQTQKAGEAFAEIIRSVKDSSDKVMDIASASEEQAAQSDSVLQAVQNIAAITQETSASTEETAASSLELAKTAEALSNLTTQFKI